MERYDIKILLALLKCLEGSPDFFRWLLNNGYPELAAFSNAVRGDKEALQWLFANKQEWLGIIVNAIDGLDKARVWLGRMMHPVNLMFAMACCEEERALRWLQERDLKIFLLLAREVHEIQDVLDAENSGPYVYHTNS